MTPLLIATAHKTGGTRTHYLTVFWFCSIDIVHLAVRKQVSDRETQGQNGNSAENRVVTDYGQNKVETRQKHAFWKGKKKGQKVAFFFSKQIKGIKKVGNQLNKTPQT